MLLKKRQWANNSDAQCHGIATNSGFSKASSVEVTRARGTENTVTILQAEDWVVCRFLSGLMSVSSYLRWTVGLAWFAAGSWLTDAACVWSFGRWQVATVIVAQHIHRVCMTAVRCQGIGKHGGTQRVDVSFRRRQRWRMTRRFARQLVDSCGW